MIEELDNEKFYFKFANVLWKNIFWNNLIFYRFKLFTNVIFDTLKAFGLVQDSADNYEENDQTQSYFALLN